MARHRRSSSSASTVLTIGAVVACLLLVLVAASAAQAAPHRSKAGYSVYKLSIAGGPTHVLGYSNPSAIPVRLKARYDRAMVHDPLARFASGRKSGAGATASFAFACNSECTQWFYLFYGNGCNYGDLEIQHVWPSPIGKASLHQLFQYCALTPWIGHYPAVGAYITTAGQAVHNYATYTPPGNFYNYNGQGPESGWFQQSFGTVCIDLPSCSSPGGWQLWDAHINLYLHAEGTAYVHMYAWAPR